MIEPSPVVPRDLEVVTAGPDAPRVSRIVEEPTTRLGRREGGPRAGADAGTGDVPPDGEPLTFALFVARTIERRRVIFRTMAVLVALAAVAAAVIPRSYRSAASFVTSGTSTLRLPGGLGSGGAGVAGGAIAGFAAQLGLGSGAEPSESPGFYEQLVRSRELGTRLLSARFPNYRTSEPADSARLLELLVDSVSLAERLGLRERDDSLRMERALELLGKDALDVVTDGRTNMVFITAHSRWPELSAAMANRVTELVGAFNVEHRVSRAKAKRSFVEKRLEEALDELNASEARLRDFYVQNRSWRTSPGLQYEESRLRRQSEIASTVYLSLRQEFEAARIAEVNDAPVITVVDRAVPARRPEYPKAVPMIASAFLIGAILGTLLAGALVLLDEWAAREPAAAASLRSALRRPARRR